VERSQALFANWQAAGASQEPLTQAAWAGEDNADESVASRAQTPSKQSFAAPVCSHAPTLTYIHI